MTDDNLKPRDHLDRPHGRTCSLRPDSQLRVNRPILNQPRFNETYGLREPGPALTPSQEIQRIVRKKWTRKLAKNKCGPRCAWDWTKTWFPALDWIPKYDFRRLIAADVIAGITVGVMNVPQGMAYSILAGLPPVCGLYTSFIPTLFYFLMGTSRQCSLGTFAVISMMTSKIIGTYAGHSEANPHITDFMGNGTFNGTMEVPKLPGGFTPLEMKQMQVGMAAAFLTGLWQLLFGVLGFGALTVYLSDQLVQGFTCAAAFHVFTSQLGNVFGLSVRQLPEYYGLFKIIRSYVTFFKVIDQARPAAIVIAFVTAVILIIIKYFLNTNAKIKRFLRVPIPAELVVVIIGAAVSYSFNFEKTFNVTIVKHVPRGMPPATMPDWSVMPNIIGDTFALAIVTFAITVTLGMLFASKHNYSVSPNQEFKALAVGNIVGGFFQCFPSGASLARSAVQDDSGGRTQIVSLVQCTIVLIVILALGPLLEPLPRPVLGAIVMVSLFHLLEQVAELYHLWKISFVDWTIFLVVFLAVLILDVDIGVGIGVAYAIMTVMFRLQKPKVRGMGRMPGTDLYKPVDVYTTACQVPNVRIVRVDAPIYFANAAYIKTRLYNLAGLNDAIKKLQEHTDDVEEASSAQKYAFTNTLAIEDDEEPQTDVAQYKPEKEHGTLDRQSVGRRVDRMSLKDQDELELGTKEEGSGIPEYHVVLDCSEVCFVDVTGVSFIKKTCSECKEIGVELLLANTNNAVRNMLEICRALEYVQPHQMFVTVHDAVLYAFNMQARAGKRRRPSIEVNPSCQEMIEKLDADKKF
ncbi:hypothetical protein RvY_18575 [Ramazzottius varieornatus]|uniref:STAS domain-containing protein n=1 Tax=Ramazzottius varieornatus TaxID=947166 RepID=A0A1D1WBE9_RAMVA|nr:hypothetical protein RvY_18575 [Ramazzottius varieornatus]